MVARATASTRFVTFESRLSGVAHHKGGWSLSQPLRETATHPRAAACFDEYRNLTANESVCTGVHSYHHNSSSQPAAAVNHTVNASLHWQLTYVGRNATLDDDRAAESRCANTTWESECKNTAQCTWDAGGFACIDPSVEQKTTSCADVASAFQCAQSSLSCAYASESESCVSEDDCDAFLKNECEVDSSLCEWATAEACRATASTDDGVDCAAVTCKGSCEHYGCEWSTSASCRLTSAVTDDDAAAGDDCGDAVATADDAGDDGASACTSITMQGECQTSSSCEWRSSDSSCLTKSSSDDDDAGDDSAACTSITKQGACQTSSSCEWRASDSSCISQSR